MIGNGHVGDKIYFEANAGPYSTPEYNGYIYMAYNGVRKPNSNSKINGYSKLIKLLLSITFV